MNAWRAGIFIVIYVVANAEDALNVTNCLRNMHQLRRAKGTTVKLWIETAHPLSLGVASPLRNLTQY